MKMSKAKNTTTRVTLKRLMTMGLGVFTVGISLLAGALTSAAAADDESSLPVYTAVAAPMVEDGTPVINRRTTNDMLVAEVAPVHRGLVGKFGTSNPTLASTCTVDFNDSDALLIQPENALNQFVVDPWRERCGDIWTEVTGTKYNHLHLDYLANDIGLCTAWGDVLGGSYARLGTDGQGEQTCTAFDPLTEPRSSPRSHSSDEVVRFKMYDIDGYQPFRLDRIRVKDQAIRLCAQPMDAGEGLTWEAATPGGLAGASCWTLSPGYWDLSSYTDNTGVVTMTGANNNASPFAFDDIDITDQS